MNKWNEAAANSHKSQKKFNKILKNADDTTRMYLESLNKSKGSIDGLKKANNAAKQSTIGLTIAENALNAAIGAGIGIAINLAIEGISKLINYQQELIEKSNEAIEAFENSRDALNNNKKSIDEISSDYAKLAQGVDNLGRNVSLNAEEYAKYNDIVNQIADMFPEMIQGYTDEGNAIIANKGNVEELTKAYENQKKAYQDLIITKSSDAFAGYKAKVSTSQLFGDDSYLEQKKQLDELLESLYKGKEAFEEFYSNQYISDVDGEDAYSILNSIMKSVGFDRGGWMSIEERFALWTDSENLQKLKSYREKLISDINTETAKIKPIMTAFMEQSYS